MPGTNGNQIDIGLGDIYIEAGVPSGATEATSAAVPAPVRLYASTTIGGTVTLASSGDSFDLTLQDNPTIDIQIVEAPKGADLTALASQYREMLTCMIPQLLTGIVQAIPVPSPAIGEFGLPGIAANAKWGLGNATLDRTAAYYAITGDIVVK